MDGSEDAVKIIFKQDDDHDFEEEEEKVQPDGWPSDFYQEILEAIEAPDTEAPAVEESGSIDEKKSVETLITSSSSSSSDEIGSFSSLESQKSLTHPCLKHISLSDSQLKFLDIYNFYPVPKDPGIKKGFWTLYPHPTRYKPDGVDKFFDVVKALGATPIPRMRDQLTSEEVDLSFYGVDTKIVQALFEALLKNDTVKKLNLQDSPLSEEACYYLNKLLMRNAVLSSLNLKFCKIGVEGARRLEEAMSLSSALTDLNLSYCELGSRGFKCVAGAVATNTLLKSLDISNNHLGEESAASLRDMLVLNDSLERLNLSWNVFNTRAAAEKLFDGLLKNKSLAELDLSWNSMSRSCVFYLTKYMMNSSSIQRLNVTANRFTDDEAPKIAYALVLNKSLREFFISNNPIRSDGISELMKKLSSIKFIDSPLLLLDLKSYWAKNDVLPVLDYLKEAKPSLTISLGGILENFTIVGPDLKELYFKMANHEAMMPKKKKDKKNFGHFVLSLSDTNTTKEDFTELLSESKIKISDNLVKQIMKQFMVTKKYLSQAALKESYMVYFPDTKLPPSPPVKVEKIKDEKDKKSKSQKKKKLP